MKKVVVATVLLAVMICACVCELVLTTRAYADMEDAVKEIVTSFDSHPDQLDDQQVLASIDNAERVWHDWRDYLSFFSHHNVIREVDRGLVRLKRYSSENQYADARTELDLLLHFVVEMSGDNHLTLPNII